MIGIIDYGMGNLRSVQKAFEALDVEARILQQPQEADDVDRLVLPGVGAFADGMGQLNQRQWSGAIRQFIETGRPFLGICLGMQLLFDSSQEDAANPDEPVPGLGILPGRVVQFVSPPAEDTQTSRLKIPHMGWNQIHWTTADPLLLGVLPGSDVYFVHSYYVKPDDETIISARTEYGRWFCASIWQHNVWATQFHPEKSQRIGLALLRNFARHCHTQSPRKLPLGS